MYAVVEIRDSSNSGYGRHEVYAVSGAYKERDATWAGYYLVLIDANNGQHHQVAAGCPDVIDDVLAQIETALLSAKPELVTIDTSKLRIRDCASCRCRKDPDVCQPWEEYVVEHYNEGGEMANEYYRKIEQAINSFRRAFGMYPKYVVLGVPEYLELKDTITELNPESLLAKAVLENNEIRGLDIVVDRKAEGVHVVGDPEIEVRRGLT